MTTEDIIRMAREAGFNTNREMIWVNGWEISPYMARFAALVAAQEREECAKVCEEIDTAAFGSERPAPNDCAAAIRARNTK